MPAEPVGVGKVSRSNKYSSLPTQACLLILVLSLLSCQEQYQKKFSFYHWKSSSQLGPLSLAALDQMGPTPLYLHYFDLDVLNGAVFPTYVLKSIEDPLKQHSVIPVIFITNRVFQLKPEIEDLSHKITKLINEISLYHFAKKQKIIQLDCDWNNETRDLYFSLLESLKEQFELTVTIRLHQIKFMDKTGIPPVSKGILMVYNIGELRNNDENSILESNIVSDYINENTTYPLPLDVALPLFSQTVLKNRDNELRLINSVKRSVLESDDHHFNKNSPNLFTVTKDTLFDGFYLSAGYQLKLEELDQEKVVESYQIIKQSELTTENVIFYHLDENTLQSVNFNQLVNSL